MMNRYFSYDTARLWDENQWKDRNCAIYPLFRHIEYLNQKKFAIAKGSGPYVFRTDGAYDPKTSSVVYEDVVNEWRERGVQFKCMEMGRLCWITMTPQAVVEGRISAPKVVVIQQSVDYEDPNWAMDVLDKYRNCCTNAAQEETVLLFSCAGAPDKDNLLSSLIQEYGTLFSISLEHLYLDVGNLLADGQRLKDVPDFTYSNARGESQDPDACVQTVSGISVLDITDRWQSHISNLWGTATAVRSVHAAFDLDRLKYSICGKHMTQAMVLEHEYSDADDPALLAYWERIGLRYMSHFKNGQRWIFMTSASALEQNGKLPTMIIFREVSHNNGYLPLIALAGFYDYIDLAAQGEMNLLLFVLEDPDSNDLLVDILEDAKAVYPIDGRRVYVTGHSHNSFYCYEFAARHPELIAGVATQGYMHSLVCPEKGGPLSMSDESIERLRKADMPVINCNGAAENNFLIYEPGSAAYENAVEGYQRRLRACGCGEKTVDEIRAAHDSPDYATRRLGVPADDTEVRFIDGVECYVGRVLNGEGKEHLRLVTIDNLPHITNPMFPALSWSFLRRFARDNETGRLVELY